MIETPHFLQECKKIGRTLFTGTPCSYLRPFINGVIDGDGTEFVPVTNEGDAVALATGAWLGGRKAVVMFQNSGLGNAVNPITSLSYITKVPFLGIVTLRGEPGGPADEPQHLLMGQITEKLLELMQVSWSYFPTKSEDVGPALQEAERSIEEKRLPYFFVMKKGDVKNYELKERPRSPYVAPAVNLVTQIKGERSTRTQALSTIRKVMGAESTLLATTGMAGRELCEIEDSENQLYMVGSMGCALAIGVGLAKTPFKEKIVVIDGDGALLMRMGNMALAGQQRPKNLVHVLLDNGVHDSTGGQSSLSEKVDFAGVASACGYDRVWTLDGLDDFEKILAQAKKEEGLSFIRLFIQSGSPKNLGRPKTTPEQVAYRLRQHILKGLA